VQCAAAHGRACWLLTAMVIGGGGGGFGSGGCISGIGQKSFGRITIVIQVSAIGGRRGFSTRT